MEQDTLRDEHGRKLLHLARSTVECYVTGRPLPPPILDAQPPFDELRGLFVTLRVDGRLRGCMGTFHPDKPIGRLVQDIAINSLNDPRFTLNRIAPGELSRLTVEISVLSPMRRSSDPLAEFQPGVHGVLIRAGNRGGCFLPQVATEMGWTGQQMLEQCCAHKAGLHPLAWRDASAEVYLFTARIFDEDAGPGPA